MRGAITTDNNEKIEITVLPPEQRLYVYKNSTQISGQTGLIGHLRGDMDSDGQGFFTSWFDFRPDLKTDEFKSELDEVINALRSDKELGGMLESRAAMDKFCRSRPESAFNGSYSTEYGFRVNTENHAYLIRLNPAKGDYNLYCYCYKRDWLDRHIERAGNGIRFITPRYKELFRVADGDSIRIVTRDDEVRERTVRYIDDYHIELGSGFGSNIYHICEFAERMENSGCKAIIPLRKSLPEECMSVLPSDGKTLIMLKRGEAGYYPTDSCFADKADARAFADKYNEKNGISRAQEAAMIAGSLFGFDDPAADPKGYDENGRAIRRGRDRGEAR